MENISDDFAENITGFAIFENINSDFYLYATNSPDPEDEDEEEDEDDDNSTGSEDDPPIDEEVVHSPVPTKGGGRPK